MRRHRVVHLQYRVVVSQPVTPDARSWRVQRPPPGSAVRVRPPGLTVAESMPSNVTHTLINILIIMASS